MELLLITGCIKPSRNVPFLELNNFNERLKQYLETLRWAIEETNFDIIVFCDNSNYDYDFSDFIKEGTLKNKTVEILQYLGNVNNTQRFGKGYGEGEITKYAYQNSKYLKNSDHFWKLTGRLKITNINKIIDKSKYGTLFMDNWRDTSRVDTKLYKIDTSLYNEYFIDCYNNVRDMDNYYYEDVFYNTLIVNRIKYKCFRRYPIFVGCSGSTGKDYHLNSISIFFHNILCILNIHNSKYVISIFNYLRKIKKWKEI